jgi:hypothetical protein
MTPEQFAKVWRTRATRYGPAMRNELRLISLAALQRSKNLMNEEIYAKPEDRSSTGRPLWVRTGDLYAGETMEEESHDSFAIENAVAYAEPRHEANKPGRRRINPYRTAHWRDDMITEIETVMPERLHRMQLEVLSAKE